MDDKLKKELVKKLNACLSYPETVDKKVWQHVEIINQKILNLIDEIIKYENTSN